MNEAAHQCGPAVIIHPLAKSAFEFGAGPAECVSLRDTEPQPREGAPRRGCKLDLGG